MVLFSYYYFESNLKISQVALKGLRDLSGDVPLRPFVF